ncbi:MAG: hypothetical protein RLZZ15_550 [Verrucomicrobiota bacterium]|jgi:hypothetical protein
MTTFLVIVGIVAITIVAICGALVLHRAAAAADEKAQSEKIQADEAQRQADEAKYVERRAELRRKAEAKNKAEQDQIAIDLSKRVEASRISANTIQRELGIVATALSRAENEFVEGAFAPFWDAIEKAATHLSRANNEINAITVDSKKYLEIRAGFKGEAPSYILDSSSLSDSAFAASRMQGLVRLAQKDFQFATIYEQRRTNQLLVKGFRNLADALEQMTNQIESSIASLTDSFSEIADAHRSNTGDLLDSIDQVRSQMAANSESRRDHEEKQRAMLDNIQRRRKERFETYPKTFL